MFLMNCGQSFSSNRLHMQIIVVKHVFPLVVLMFVLMFIDTVFSFLFTKVEAFFFKMMHYMHNILIQFVFNNVDFSCLKVGEDRIMNFVGIFDRIEKMLWRLIEVWLERFE